MGGIVQGKILIVDPISTNRIVLKVKLVTAFYEVIQATSMAEAIVCAQTHAPDLIITALTLPDGNAASLRLALRHAALTKFIPVMAAGPQASPPERIAMLKAGVREILTHPLDETMLLGRVRSLIRAHAATAEWHMREDTTQALGLAEPSQQFHDQAHCMLVSANSTCLQTFAMQMRPVIRMKLSLSSASALTTTLRGQKLPDVFVFILPSNSAEAMDALRMVSAIRANASTRHTGIVVLQTARDSALAATALDMGADDLMVENCDTDELSLRLNAVVRRTRMAEQMRKTVRTGLQAAVFDPLTGLHNRRYAMPHLSRIADHAAETGRGFAALLADLDHFKQVNDQFGHASGDAVLIEVANRLRACIRNTDMAARIGGEEFLVVMPGTPQFQAQRAALRICQAISGTPFKVPGCTHRLNITISIGMAINQTGQADMTPDTMLHSADKALYAAKGRGRNQVTLARPAA